MAWDDPFPDLGPVKSASQRAKEVRQRRGKPPPPLEPGSRKISHFIMNLPDSAITFLGSFKGLFSKLRHEPDFDTIYAKHPWIHCYCFTRELEEENARRDILEASLPCTFVITLESHSFLQRAADYLGCPLPEDSATHLVRRVAPNKDMYCISFILPKEIAS